MARIKTVIKKAMLIVPIVTVSLFLGGCKHVKLLKEAAPTEAVYVNGKSIERDTYYIKDGTKFAPVYMPLGNVTGVSLFANGSRVFYMTNDQPFIPTHFKGEIVAYASQKTDLDDITLEKFEDLGWSIGIYGGKIEEDGYYHMNPKNTAAGSSASELFSKVVSSEIRIVSIAGEPIKSFVDEDCGIVFGTEKDVTYVIEFYAGTYYYRQAVTADTQFLKSQEVLNYGYDYIYDTKNGYRCFETPKNLVSGYYLVNGKGLMLYKDCTKEENLSDIDLNESNFDTEIDAIKAYSQEYVAKVKTSTKSLMINAYYTGAYSDDELGGSVLAPDGTIYSMDVNKEAHVISLTLSLARAGDWKVYIPNHISITDVKVEGNEIIEEYTLFTDSYSFDEDLQFKEFMINFYPYNKTNNNNYNIEGTIIRREDGKTYQMNISAKKEENKYLYLDFPYLEKGTYDIKVFYYQSQMEIGNIQILDYENNDSDIFIVE